LSGGGVGWRLRRQPTPPPNINYMNMNVIASVAKQSSHSFHFNRTVVIFFQFFNKFCSWFLDFYHRTG
ncbi:MAG TPA: hypothetical protein PLK12_01255, partial [Prolixibacteraceae bacterium]|nr:hypothetical protein [Prolixibacteraceae bacterium]